MKKIISILLVWFFLFGSHVVINAKPIINEQKWIISGAGRTIYLLKLDGSEKEIIFDKVADANSHIEVLTNSYNGKIILCKVISKTRFSYWLVDLDQNDQYPIIEDLIYRPSNTIISKDGNLVSFTTTNKEGMQIWLYDVKTKILKEFGEDVTDGIVRFVRFSYDGQFALYNKLTGTNRDYYSILCLRDFTKNRDYELTTRKDGDFDIGEFYFDNQNILLTRTLPGDDYNTLWDFNIAKRSFTFIMEISEEYISAVSLSRDGNQIALCSYNPRRPGKNFFWTMHKQGAYNLTFISEITSGMIGLRISYDGKYFLYSTENSATYIANMDGSINEELSDLVALPNLKDANWYNHPPFPPQVTAKASPLGNYVNWDPALTGTYPIAGYKVYRSVFPDKKNLTFLANAGSSETTFEDTKASTKECYYYLVRSYDTDMTESLPSNHALLDRTNPKIKITKPSTGLLTNVGKVHIEGWAEDLESGIEIASINNTQLDLDESGYFKIPYQLIEGQNIIVATVTDKSGNQSIDSIEVTLDSIAPLLQIDFPQDNTELMATETNARGTVSDNGSGIDQFTLNGKLLLWEANETFMVPIVINPGFNEFVFKVNDHAGNQNVKTLTIKGVKKITVILTIGSNQIIVNELPSIIDAPPFIDEKSGRTMVPARFVVEPIGGTIEYETETQKITIIRESDKIELWIGRNIAIVNGMEKNIDPIDLMLSPRIESGRTYLPLRFVSENIGFLVEWDPLLHQIKLVFPKKDLN